MLWYKASVRTHILRAAPLLRVKAKITVKNAVCNGLGYPYTAFLTVNLTLTLRVEPLSRLQTDGYIFTGPDSWVHTHEYILTGMTYSRVQGLAFPTGMIPVHLAPRVTWEVYKLFVTLAHTHTHTHPHTHARVHTAQSIHMGTYSRVQGLAFPTGMIPAHLAPRVKWEVYKLLVTREGGRDREESFPTARTLLLFDTREFLNVRVSTCVSACVYMCTCVYDGRDRKESFSTGRTLLLFDTREFLNVRVSTYAHI